MQSLIPCLQTSIVDSHAVNGQLLNTNNHGPVASPELPLSDNPWAEEVTNVVVAGPAAAGGGRGPRGPSRAAVIRAKLLKALIGGVVSLIVLPGIIILGVLMKQTMAGIALSSAITALANLFAGIYYYLNKRD